MIAPEQPCARIRHGILSLAVAAALMMIVLPRTDIETEPRCCKFLGVARADNGLARVGQAHDCACHDVIAMKHSIMCTDHGIPPCPARGLLSGRNNRKPAIEHYRMTTMADMLHRTKAIAHNVLTLKIIAR